MPRPAVPETLVPYLQIAGGVSCSAALLAVIGRALDMSLLLAPLLATAALKHTAPHIPGVAPRRVIGGHTLGAVVGVLVGAALGEGALATALAAAGAAVVTMRLDVLHAPGVATAAVAIHHAGEPWFPIVVAAVGAATLVATTMVLSPVLHGRYYPSGRPATTAVAASA